MGNPISEHCVTILNQVLFEKDLQILDEQLKDLIEENHSLGRPKEGFLLGGAFHTQTAPKLLRGIEKKLIHPSLLPKGREYINACNRLQTERQRLNQGLTLLLQSCRTMQDVRDALPDTVVSLLPEVSKLSRFRGEAWAFQDRPLQLHQHKEIQALLDFYVANRILY